MAGTEPTARPAAVRLHPHRGIGWGLYGTVTVVVLTLVLLGVGTNLRDGRYGMAAVIAVAGLAVTAFLGTLTHALVVPGLVADGAGLRGRLPRGHRVDAAWADVTVDVDGDGGPGVLRLDVGGERLTVGARSWVGFGDFVWLVASTPAAADRLTPAAVLEVTRLLRAGVAATGPDRSTWH